MLSIAALVVAGYTHRDVGTDKIGQPAVGQCNIEIVLARDFYYRGYLRGEGVLILVIDVRTSQVSVFAVIVVKDTNLRWIGHITRGTAGEHVVSATMNKVRRGFAGKWRTHADEVLRKRPVGIQIVSGQFCTNHLPMRTLKPDVGLSCFRVGIHVEVTHTKSLGLQALDNAVWSLEAVCLENDEIAVGIHRLNPADPLAGLFVVEDVRAVKRLRKVQRRERIQRVWLDDQPQVFPVVKVLRAIGSYAPGPDIGAAQGVLLVFTIPIVGAVLFDYLRRMGLDGIAIGVEPSLAWPYAAVPRLGSGSDQCQDACDCRNDDSLHFSLDYSQPGFCVRLGFFSLSLSGMGNKYWRSFHWRVTERGE